MQKRFERKSRLRSAKEANETMQKAYTRCGVVFALLVMQLACSSASTGAAAPRQWPP